MEPILYRVIYGDTDSMGVVYHANYLRIFEIGRNEAMRALGVPYSEIEKDGQFLPVVELFVRYRNPARYDDLLRIKVNIRVEGAAKIRFDYVIVHRDTEKIIAEGYTVHGVIDAVRNRPVRVPPKLRNLFPLVHDDAL